MSAPEATANTNGPDFTIEGAITNGNVADVYSFHEEIGKGAFSVVFRAIDKQSNSSVAVKKVAVKDEKALKMLGRECKIQKELQHPGIINLEQVFQEPQCVHLVLEYAAGGELFEKIVELDKYSEEDARKLMKHLLETVAMMHEKKIVHRDFKPENLLLRDKNDSITKVKIADFGIATHVEEIEPKGTFGSPGYMAPEMLEKKPYDEKVDMWAMGIILFNILSGDAPWEDDEREFKLKFDKSWKGISDEAKDLVRQLLQINPKKRLSAAQALEHPWIKQHQDCKHHSLAESQKHMQVFNARRKMKHGITAVMAMQKFQSLLGLRKSGEHGGKEETQAETTNAIPEAKKEQRESPAPVEKLLTPTKVVATEEEEQEQEQENKEPTPPKRKRGRPKKEQKDDDGTAQQAPRKKRARKG